MTAESFDTDSSSGGDGKANGEIDRTAKFSQQAAPTDRNFPADLFI